MDFRQKEKSSKLLKFQGLYLVEHTGLCILAFGKSAGLRRLPQAA
jgi:hypothetical protein